MLISGKDDFLGLLPLVVTNRHHHVQQRLSLRQLS